MKRNSLLNRVLIIGISSLGVIATGHSPLYGGAPVQDNSVHIYWMSGPIQEEIIAGVTLSPNPADTYTNATVTLNSASNMSISIINMTGATVANFGTAYYTAGSHIINLDIKELNPGMYLVVCEAGGQTMSKRLTIY